MLRTPHTIRTIAVALVSLLSALILGLIFIPWQQSVTGTGRVMIMSPMQRPQNIEAQISGRIVRWAVQEGQIVKAGQVVAELKDIDSKYLDEEQVTRLRTQREFQLAKRAATQERAAALDNQNSELSRSRSAVIPAARERVQQAGDRLRAAQQTVEAAKQNLTTTELNIKRISELHEKGLRSRRDLEVAELDQVRARTEVERASAALEVAKRDISIGNFDQSKIDADTAAGLSALQASLASVRESVATINSDIQKLDVEIENTSARRQQGAVIAPSDGQIARLIKFGAGTTVKAGDVLAVIAPVTNDLAVELLLSDNDTPLVAVGRHVRLQFAGWPAIQFSGWPSIAGGTFGGRVSVIDPIDDGKSQYRVIVTPDYDTIRQGKDEPWPNAQLLRSGAEASGWIMLDNVSLGFELWRQFNAFPPTVSREPLNKKETPKDEKKLGAEVDLKGILK